MLRRTAAVLLPLAGLLALHTACEPVEPGEMAHTSFTGPAYLTVGGQLTGAHAQIPCEGCHEGQEAPFGPVADDCIACHDADRQNDTHFVDAPSCNEGCHRVVDTCWAFLSDPACTGGPTESDTDADADADADADTDTDTGTVVPSGCSTCHEAQLGGTFLASGAPAGDAHQPHLAASSGLWAPAVAVDCSTCHPAGDYEGGLATHQDGVLDVPLTGIAVGVNEGATYQAGSCSNTWCHGGGLPERPAAPVAWSGGAAAAACGTCHGSPPPADHPNITGCSGCHGPTATGPATIDAPDLHIDGILVLP